MKNLSLTALLAAGVLAGGMTTANAADLGGNCCADLEERIAELEATTARKGNRKVSLTVSGWVSQQISVWDDGVETNAYVSDLGSTLNSNFKLSGSAKINEDLSAGYLLHVEVVGNENLTLSQGTSSAGKGLDVIQSLWFIKSNTLGKVSLGRQSSAADNAALLPDGSGSLVFANYIMYDINSFGLRLKKTTQSSGFVNTFGGSKPFAADNKFGAPGARLPHQNLNWGSLATCQSFGGDLGLSSDCDGVPNNNIRYDTPAYRGFSASASWGEDDIWAVSGRYAGEFNGIKLAAAIGFFESTNDNGSQYENTAVRARGGKEASALQAGVYIQHVPTGLFVYGAYGKDFNDRTGSVGLNGVASNFGAQQKDADNFYIKAGIRQRWNSLGHTVVYGEYGENNDKMSNALWENGVTDSNLEQYGIGIVQEIDSAAMSLFANYRRYEADATNTFADGTFIKSHYEPAELFKFGALINF